MEITSGGTTGPRLAEHLWELDNNVYGTFTDAPAVKAMAEMFVQLGWRARASSWTEYEVEHDWACIELLPTNPQLFRGVVDPPRVDDLAAVLTGFGLGYSIELWDENHNTLIRELTGGLPYRPEPAED